MKESKLREIRKSPIIEILDNPTAGKIKIKGYKKILMPYNNSFSFCIFVPEKETKNILPFFIEDILQNIPIKIIILNSEFRLISTNVGEKDFLEAAYKKVKEAGKNNLEKLYLLESVNFIFSFKKDNYKLTINPLIRDINNPGYICTVENTTFQKTEYLNRINQIVDEILSAKTLKSLKEISGEILSLLKIETLSFFKKGKSGFKPVFSWCGITEIKTLFPQTVDKEVKEKGFLLIPKQFLSLKGIGKYLKKFIFVYRLEVSKRYKFLVIGSSDSPIDEQTIKKYNWILKIFYLTVMQLKKKRKLGNIFEDYKLPITLVNKQTLKIEYSNKSFKKYFGNKNLFFNEILSPQSNIKILKKLDTEFEPFSDYLEASTGDNFNTIVKVTVIPEIIEGNKNLFAVIFKTQKHEIKMKLNLQHSLSQKKLEIETIPILIQKYSSIIIKTRNIEKSLNFILKDISKHLKAIGSFLGEIDKSKKNIVPLNIFSSDYPFSIESDIKNIERDKAFSQFLKKESYQFTIRKNNLTIFAVKLKPWKNKEYIWGLVFDNNNQPGSEEKIAISSFANLITIALRKKEKEKLYAEIEKEKEKLEKINKEIITTISHEIKTPLTSILGLSEIILNKLSKEDKKLATSVKENALNLLELLETMLEVNKIEEKSIEVIKKRSVNTNEFIKSIESFVKGVNKNPNVKFRIVTENLQPFFIHDSTIIYRIIVNLLDNAFRYTKRGMVTLSLNFENEKLIIEVKDTGTGISRKNLENIFIPFFQEKSPNKNNKKNVGLGLYIVKRLCDIIKAEIEVKSEKKIGTYFKIIIPLKENYELNTNN